MHFMFKGSGWDLLITALYVPGDPYETSDAAFGVKDCLAVDMKEYRVQVGHRFLEYDFVLVSEEESWKLREQRAQDALEKLGGRVGIVEGLPVPDMD